MAKRPRPQPVDTETKEQRITRYEERGESLAAMWQVALPRIVQLVPAHIVPDRLLASALTARNRNPDLMKCTDVSVIRGVIQAAQMGFEVSGLGGKAWLVPFWNKDKQVHEAQLMVGYRGLVELALRTGQIIAIWSREVYAHESFKYLDGLQQVLEHVPEGPRKEDEIPIGAYAVALYTSGFRRAEAMNAIQLDKIRRMSKAPDGPAWTKSRSEMDRKTVTRRLCKWLPDSYELARTLDAEDRMERGEVPLTDIDLTPPAQERTIPATQTERVKEKILEQMHLGDEAPPPEDEPAEGGDDGERDPGEEG